MNRSKTLNFFQSKRVEKTNNLQFQTEKILKKKQLQERSDSELFHDLLNTTLEKIPKEPCDEVNIINHSNSNYAEHDRLQTALLLTQTGAYIDHKQELTQNKINSLRCRIVSGIFEDLIIDCELNAGKISFCLCAPKLSLFYALKTLKKKLEEQLSQQYFYDIQIEIAHV